MVGRRVIFAGGHRSNISSVKALIDKNQSFVVLYE